MRAAWLFLVLAALALAFVPNARAAETSDDALRAYQDGQFVKAREIAKKFPKDASACLVAALCQIHDGKNQDLSAGVAALKKLWLRQDLAPAVWRQTALAYGRTVQALQNRKMFPEFDGIDVEPVFKSILDRHPDSPEACEAIVCLTEKYLTSQDVALQQRGLDMLESFLASYKGAKEDTVAVHLHAEGFWISLRKDYARSLQHLEAAYAIGVPHAYDERIILFRIGRIMDCKLHRTREARERYEEYIAKYPYSRETPVVARYLRELAQGD